MKIIMTGEQGINITAIAVSVLLHAILFVQLTDTALSSQAQAPNFSTRISLNLMPPQAQPPELVKADLPPPEPVRKPKPELKPEPRVKPEVVKAEPPVIPELAMAPRVAEQIERGQVNETAPIRQHYLNNLLTYIEGHKYYPQSARSRGIKGSIDVTFELLNNGDISGLKASGGPMILRKAAEQAIASALPLPIPPAEVNCPLVVSYAMQFELN